MILNLINSTPIVRFLAWALVIPTYITFFIGKEPLIQGIAFSLYVIPFIALILRNRKLQTSGIFLVYLTLFIAAWIIPSLINAFGSKLESELVRLPILFFHVIIFTVVIVTLHDYLKKNPDKQFNNLIKAMFWMLLPMALLISLKTLYLDFQFPIQRPSPFGIHPNVAAEIMLTLLLFASQLRHTVIQWMAYALTIFTCYLLQSRGGLIASYLALFVIYVFPAVTRINLQKKSALAIGGVVVMGLLFFYQDLYDLILKVSMLDRHTQDIAGRGQMWLLGLESIKTNPFTGLGFWVNPMGLSIPEHFPLGTVLGDPALEIHNAFIRIATENGLVLLAMILALMGLAAYRLHRNKNYLELAVIMGVTFFLFFSTRHLTLNLMNILLYTVILKAMMLPKPRKMLKITKRRKIGND